MIVPVQRTGPSNDLTSYANPDFRTTLVVFTCNVLSCMWNTLHREPTVRFKVTVTRTSRRVQIAAKVSHFRFG